MIPYINSIINNLLYGIIIVNMVSLLYIVNRILLHYINQRKFRGRNFRVTDF